MSTPGDGRVTASETRVLRGWGVASSEGAEVEADAGAGDFEESGGEAVIVGLERVGSPGVEAGYGAWGRVDDGFGGGGGVASSFSVGGAPALRLLKKRENIGGEGDKIGRRREKECERRSRG